MMHSLRGRAGSIGTALVTALFLGTLLPSFAGEAAASCPPPPSGLVGWWPAEGTATDVVGGNDGTLGSTTFTTAVVGQGFHFPTPAGVTIPGASIFNVQSPGFTAEFWMQGIHDQPGALYMVLEKSHTATTGWAFGGDPVSGILTFLIGKGSGGPVAVSSLADLLDGSFHHVAGTWDGSDMHLFVDGVLQGSAAITTPAATGGSVNVGYFCCGGRPFRGVVDEVSIYDRALSQAEIQSIVTAGADGKCSPCGDGVLNPSEQCDDGNTVPGDCCSPTCQGETPGMPCADDGVACTLDHCGTTGRCLHPSDGTCPCVAPPPGIVSWWRADGSAADAIDGNPGSLQGAATFAAGAVAQAFDFSGGGHVFVNHDTNLDLNSPGFAAEFWMQGVHDQPEALYNVIDKSHDGGDGKGWTFQGSSGPGSLAFVVGVSPGNFAAATAGLDLLDGQLHHVAGTWTGATMRIYVDGTPYESAPLTTPNNNTRPLRIGAWQFGRQFLGLADEVTVYDRGLTAAEAQSIFSAGGAGKCTPGVCGNGAVDSGEQCDDGNTTPGDCCDAACQAETGPCTDGVFCNGADTCSGGSCSQHAGDPCAGGSECADACSEAADNCFDPSGTPCTDANACTNPDVCTGGACTSGAPVVCALCETCDTGGGCIMAPRTGCKLPVASAKASLLVKDKTPDSGDQVVWKWKLGDATTLAELGDPLTTDDYALCLFAGPGTPVIVFRGTAPAGGTCGTKPCWKAAGTTGFQYTDSFTTPDGTLKLQVKAGLAGKAKASVKGKGLKLTGRLFGLPAPPLALPVRAQLQAENGLCLEANYGAPSTNQAGLFKAKAD